MSNSGSNAGDGIGGLGPFNWTQAGHVVVKAGEAVNWEFQNASDFIKRVQSIEYGLSAETEFAAILSWLGRCSLVHRLEQDYFSSQSGANWSIPDLFAVIEHRGESVPVFIEVKTRGEEILKMKTSELDAMRQYAAIHSIPLLFAWKPRRLGFWVLVDPIYFVEKNGKSILEFGPAIKNDLMGTVAGDFWITPSPGAGLFFDMKIVEKCNVTEQGFEAVIQIEKAEYRDGKGGVTTNLPFEIFTLLFTRMDEHSEVDEWKVYQSFVARGEAVHAQEILRTAVAFRSEVEKPIRWRHVAKDLDSYLTVKSLHEAVKQRIGTFVQYMMLQHPGTWPAFLPATWNALDKAD